MFGKTFGHDSIRKYVIIFGTLFNNLYLTRQDNEGSKVDTIKVPLSYSPKDKMLARVLGDPSIDRKVAIVLPRMAFEMVDMQYDPTIKLSKVATFKNCETGSTIYGPVPYNFNFNLYVAVKNSDDGTKIVEQILPYFTPEWSISANMLPEIGRSVDVPIILNNVTKEDSYEGVYQERRAIVWTLSFTIKGFIFGPVTDRERINKAITKIFSNWSANASPDVTTIITPENMDEF